MLKRSALIVFTLLVFEAVLCAQPANRTIVVTIDDLPYVQVIDGGYLTGARPATSEILSALRKHKVPAIGFVNEHLEDSHERDSAASVG